MESQPQETQEQRKPKLPSILAYQKVGVVDELLKTIASDSERYGAFAVDFYVRAISREWLELFLEPERHGRTLAYRNRFENMSTPDKIAHGMILGLILADAFLPKYIEDNVLGGKEYVNKFTGKT